MKIRTLLIYALSAVHLLSADADSAATAVNTLGLELHRQLPNDVNLCTSPYSIQTALAMTYLGASGQTQAEMAQVLHFPADKQQLGASFQALRQALDKAQQASERTVKASKQHGGPSEAISLNVANRLFGQKSFEFCPPFLKQVDAIFTAPLQQVDFRTKFDAERKKINQWVEKQTRERIKDLIPKGGLTSDTTLVLVNALYFKAAWASEFSKEATKDAPFHLSASNAVQVPSMVKEQNFRYLDGEGFKALALPYVGGELQLLVIVPDALDGLAKVEAAISHKTLVKCSQAGYREVQLQLPKFRLTSDSMSLRDPLMKLGLSSAFDDPATSADFSEMAPKKPNEHLAIGQVFHKTFIELNEVGTEAAAATAVVMMRAFGAMPAPKPKPIVLKVDRPYLFAIQHQATGACLFLGRVVDPR